MKNIYTYSAYNGKKINFCHKILNIGDKFGSVIATKSELVTNLSCFLLQKLDFLGNANTYKAQ